MKLRPQGDYRKEIWCVQDTPGSGEGQVMDSCGHSSINGRVQYLITS